MREAHRAGQSEALAQVLHNVGNVLTTVNVSATTIAERLKKSEITHFTELVRLLDDHRGDLPRFLADDARGKHLIDYLTGSAEALLYERGVLMDELGLLAKGVDHIKAIIALQQSRARHEQIRSREDPAELIDGACALTRAAVVQHRIQVVCEVAGLPAVRVTRHLVLQILVNLITNAVASLREVVDRPRVLRFVGSAQDGAVALEVVDNGVGLEADQLELIFRRGYTTRHGGHGFGLHLSAIQAQDMGGRLVASSAGPGLGACFTLILPVSAL